MNKIWLIGGTGDSAIIAQEIAKHKFLCLITVTTKNAQNLYPISPYLIIQIGALNQKQIKELCQQEKIISIVDASHPYAVEISQQAISIAQQKNIPYLRYERPSINPNSHVILLDSFETLINNQYLEKQRVLLTVGYQALPLFKNWQNRAVLFARVLPRLESLEAAINAGFSSDRLIALRPPMSLELERALWQQWKISLVVTKASGKQGGEDIKTLVAKQLGIPLIVIKRPQINYPNQTDQISDIIEFCRQYS
ncbi:MAG TPA: cobalt-precorrin-6A reductase [Cyanothece sp. UBA12306]|nr:cobalt-precorrin-6A reductase [Cyanothece sp. UBA12306]